MLPVGHLIDIFYAELVEHACGMANLHMGDFFSNISNGIDTYSIREPLGVCAGICSFNFPAMIPLLVCFYFSLLFSLAHYILFLMRSHWDHYNITGLLILDSSELVGLLPVAVRIGSGIKCGKEIRLFSC